MRAAGAYLAVGRAVHLARKERGLSRRKLVWWIREDQTLEVSVTGAALMVNELEDDGLVMNDPVLRRILYVVGIPPETIAGLMTTSEPPAQRSVTG